MTVHTGAGREQRSDAELLAAVRTGDTDAYAVLYERHLAAARRAASCLGRTAAEREDLVADAFTRVLRALRDGRGPTEEFRAYLLVTMRNAATSSARGASVSLYADVPECYLPVDGDDRVLRRADADAAATAFASLPERWRTVLWHTEVEGESPATIAPLLGMRPNAVAALAYRAREGLRQAYLNAHLSEVRGRECRATVGKLASWVRRGRSGPMARKIAGHLDRCAECRARAAVLTEVNGELRAQLGPLVLGAPLAAAYVSAPAVVAEASGLAVAKAVLVKVGAAVVVAASAMSTVASTPSGEDGRRSIPAMSVPIVSTGTIDGPAAPSRRAENPAPPPVQQVPPPVGPPPPPETLQPVPPEVPPEEAAPGRGGGRQNGQGSMRQDKQQEKQQRKEDKQERKEEKQQDKGGKR